MFFQRQTPQQRLAEVMAQRNAPTMKERFDTAFDDFKNKFQQNLKNRISGLKRGGRRKKLTEGTTVKTL